MNPIDRHERYRELVSDRLAGTLDPASERRLRGHLADCPRCRMVERAYLREQGLLRALSERSAPRDLWARTSAALDHEMARRPRASRRRRDDGPARQGSPLLMLTALSSFLVAIAVVGTQLERVAPPAPPRMAFDPRIPLPTPFDVPPQQLAFVEVTADGLAVYGARVDRVCPSAAIDCADITPARQGFFRVPGEVTADDLDLHGADGKLALLTVDGEGYDTVSVLFLPPPTLSRIPSYDPPPAASVSPPARSDPPSNASTGPSGDPSRSPPVARTPPRSDPPEESSVGPTQSPEGTSRPVKTPAEGSASVRITPDPSDPPTPTRTPPDRPSGSPPGSSSLPSLAATPVPPAVHAVLSDVRVVGAPPAWSVDGRALAFSAMPADRSRGPDVYLWRDGDDEAIRLTNDHRSYFASWAAGRVVVSRAGRVTTAEGDSEVVATTHLIDPVTGAERKADGGGRWLPSVDPTGRFAVAWSGELQLTGRMVSPVRGGLYLIDWRRVDPFDAPEPTEGPEASAEPDEPPRDRDDRPRGDRPNQSDGGDRLDDGRADRVGRRLPPSDPPTPGPTSDAEPSGAEPDAGAPHAVPLEPQRDERMQPVRAWRVDWSDDGSAFGFWVSEQPDETWGKLAVHMVVASRSGVERGAVILEGTLARRAFTLGRDRVAWIGPSVERVEGEVRLRTWGSRGSGDLRFREIDVSTALPAF